MNKLLLALLLLFSLRAVAQEEEISGTVTDEKGAPLHGATVFLSGTKYGNTTNSKGKFYLSGVAPQTYEIVVKMIGFVPFIKKIHAGEKTIDLNVKLEKSNTVLNDVSITGADPNRERYLSMFLINFIGEPDMLYCKILNPDELKFHYDKKTGVLNAHTENLLQIEDHDLGYRLNYLFTSFILDPKSGMSYSGHAYFEELKGTPEQQQRWETYRKAAHINSIDKFFKIAFREAQADTLTLK